MKSLGDCPASARSFSYISVRLTAISRHRSLIEKALSERFAATTSMLRRRKSLSMPLMAGATSEASPGDAMRSTTALPCSRMMRRVCIRLLSFMCSTSMLKGLVM